MNNEDPNGPDEIDRAWLDSIVPADCLAVGFIGVVLWLDEDGDQCWRVYSQIDAPITTAVGLLEFAKLEMIARTDTGLPLRYPHLDDDA